MKLEIPRRIAGIPLSAAGGLPPRRSAMAPVEAGKSAAVVQDISPALSRILRPQAAYRWLLPYLSAITPQYIESTLRGALAGNHVQAWELFDLMMDTDPEIASCIQEFTEGVTRRKMIVEPYSDEDAQPTPRAIEKSKVASAALRNMSPSAINDENEIGGTIKDIISARFVGTAILETDWYQDGDNSNELNLIDTPSGQILAPRCTYWVHPVCYAWDMNGRLGLRTELTPNTAAFNRDVRTGNMTANPVWNMISTQPRPSLLNPFPEHKFLIAIHKAKSGTALGGPMFRVLAWLWCATNFCNDWMLNNAQLFSIPFRKANYASGIGDNTKQEILNMLQMMGSAGYGAFPEGVALEFIKSDGGAAQNPSAWFIEYANSKKRELILGQTMTGQRMGGAQSGSKAGMSVEKDVKADKIDAGAQFVCTILNQQLVRSIIFLNYNGDITELPILRMLEEEEGNLEDAQRDTALAGAGLKIGVNFMRKKYGIPAPAEGEETLSAPSNPQDAKAPPGQTTGDGGDESGNSARRRETRRGLEASANQMDADEAHLAVAVHESIMPLLKRLQSIANVTDPETQQHLIEKLLADFPHIADAIKADSTVAKTLSPKLEQALIQGIQKKP